MSDGHDDDRVDLGKRPGPDASSGPSGASADDQGFDPYRFGRPEHPVPPEFAPPGYVPDAPTAPPDPYPYAQAPYGQPPYPGGPYPGGPYAGYPPPPPGHRPQTGPGGKAITALVLGIASIALCWLTFFAAVVIVPAVIFGLLALNESKTRGGGRGMAIAGLACAAVGAVLATLITVVVLNAYEDCGGAAQSGDPGFTECVQNRFL